MQNNEYKQKCKVLSIRELRKFFININRQFGIITKIMFHDVLHYINRHNLSYFFKTDPRTP